jgi:hypothetical protein
MSKRAKRLQRISRRLTTHQLRRLQDKDVALGFGDLFSKDDSSRGSPYFLGYYSPSGIKYALEQFGFFEELKKKGYENLELTFNTKDPYKQRIAAYLDEKNPNNLIGELVVKPRHITIYPPYPSLIYGRTFDFISIEWLCLQNIKSDFHPNKPRLPGQKYPGLGMGEMVMEILTLMCGRMRTAGLVNIPERFHNAQMYSSHLRYINPLIEAKRCAIARDLMKNYSLSESSWAVELNCVLENEQPFEWPTDDQIIPLDRDLKDFFDNKDYIQYVNQKMEEFHYRVDKKIWAEKKHLIHTTTTC